MSEARRVWKERLTNLLRRKAHPGDLCAAGVSAELLAFANLKIHDLLAYYPLEHLCTGFGWQMEDLHLLGFDAPDLADQERFPLIVLYDIGFRAQHLFALDIGFVDLERLLLMRNEYAAQLLRLNLPYWQSALGGA